MCEYVEGKTGKMLYEVWQELKQKYADLGGSGWSGNRTYGIKRLDTMHQFLVGALHLKA